MPRPAFPLPYMCQNNMYSSISLLHINLHLRFCFQRTQPRTRGEEVEETDRKGKKAKEGSINEGVTGVGSWTHIFLGVLLKPPSTIPQKSLNQGLKKKKQDAYPPIPFPLCLMTAPGN